MTVGSGTAICVGGCCFHADARIRDLRLVVDGREQPVSAFGMPRLDYFRDLHPGLDPYATVGLDRDPGSILDPLLHAYRSGFWATAVITSDPNRAESVLGLRAELEGGQHVSASLGIVQRTALPPPAEPRPVLRACRHVTEGQPLVAICMATYNPPADLFVRQIESIREQSYGNWVCVVSDDCSSREHRALIARTIGDDPRFLLSPSSRRLGFYLNFERALALAPAAARLMAMADQDDAWYSDKLAVLVDEIGDAQLIYSDARVVTRDGQPIADTWWQRRGNNHSDLLSVLTANSITGAASLFERDLLADALPFPPAQFAHYHDHWIGLVALARGEIRFVDRPLYDYFQHEQAWLGHAAANRMTSIGQRLRNQRPPRERVRQWRLNYFADVCRLMQFATVLDLRCGSRMSPPKRRALRRFLRAEASSSSLARLAARGARELVRPRPETLGAEWMLFHALLWRRLLAATARDRPQRRLRFDAVPPPSLSEPSNRTAAGGVARALEDKIAPLSLKPSRDAPPRLNLLIPTFDLEHFFGGYIAKMNLARRLSERGMRVRLVTVDPTGRLPRDWRRAVEAYNGLDGLFERVEVAFGRECGTLEVSPEDSFVATTWWTAHIAHQAVRTLGSERFVYLIQEYEPFTFSMGSYAALAAESYRFPHFALFSSELLRGYFRAQAIGAFADGTSSGDSNSISFQNAITRVAPPTADELRERIPRRLLVYARPETHAARNMFELAVMGLTRALRQGGFEGWELNGIGTLTSAATVALGGDAHLRLLPRKGQNEYAETLRDHDVGLSLMYTPHPSLVPIEMASGGMLTVTNTFANKTREALAGISANLIAAEPAVESITRSLLDAAARSGDYAGRIAASRVNWATDWDVSFADELIDRVIQALVSDSDESHQEGGR